MQTQTHAIGRRDLIVVGGWRGSLEALGRITSELPADFPAAVLAALHDAPHTLRLINAVVGRRTPLPVGYAIHGEEVKPGRIYISPPNQCLTVNAPGTIALGAAPAGRDSVDQLFQSAGGAYGARVIAVILTGEGRDGTEGMRSLTLTSGVRIVQSPADAVASSMPSSAVLGDHPNYVVLLEDIGKLLMSLVAPSSAAVKQ